MAEVKRQTLLTAHLVTLDYAKPYWRDRHLSEFKGMFIRLKPLCSTHATALKEMKQALLDAGALAVRIMPRPPSDQVNLGKTAELVKMAMVSGDTLPPVRQLMRTVVDGSTSTHKNELKALFDQFADEEGL